MAWDEAAAREMAEMSRYANEYELAAALRRAFAALDAARQQVAAERQRCAQTCRHLGMNELDKGQQELADFAFELAEAIERGD